VSSQANTFPGWWPSAIAAEEAVQPPGLWEALKSDLDIQKYTPAQRPGIIYKEMTDSSGRHYMLKNGVTHSYTRLAPEEFWVWERLDGRTTVQQLVFAYFREYQAFAFGAIVSLLNRLRKENMLNDSPRVFYRELYRTLAERTLSYKLSWPARTFLTREFVIKELDGHLKRIYRNGLWLLFTVPAQILFFLIAVIGTYLFVQLARDPSFDLIEPGSVVILGLLAYIPIVIHEFGHAITAKHVGCDVHKGGVMLYYGLPAAFVDTTDVWMFGKRERLAVTWAGPYTGYIIAGLCSLAVYFFPGLSHVTSVLLLQLAFGAVAISTFNLLPLVKLDGYYLLADALEIPRLRERSLEFLTHSLLMKIRERRKWTGQERIFLAYGIVAFLSTIYFTWSGLVFWDWQAGQSISQITNLEGDFLRNAGLVLLAVSTMVYSVLSFSNPARQLIATLRGKGLLSTPEKIAIVFVFGIVALVVSLHLAFPANAAWILKVSGFAGFAFAGWIALSNFRRMSGSVYRWMWLAAFLSSLAGMASFVIELNPSRLSAFGSSLLWAGIVFTIVFFLLMGRLLPGFIGSWRGYSLLLMVLGMVLYGSLFANTQARTIAAALMVAGLIHWRMRPRTQLEAYKHDPTQATREKIAAAVHWIRNLSLREVELDFGRSTRAQVEKGMYLPKKKRVSAGDVPFDSTNMTAGERGRSMAAELEGLLGNVERLGGSAYARRVLAYGYDTLDWELMEIAEEYILKYVPHALGLSRELSTWRDELVALLRSAPVFMSLSDADLGRLCRYFKLRQFDRNTFIIRAGETGTTFYVIHKGRVEVLSPQGAILHQLGRGDYFGEVALLKNAKRNASIRTLTPVEVLVLNKSQFDKFMRTNFQGVYFDEKLLGEFQLLGTLRQIPIFEQFDGYQLRRVSKQFERVEVLKGEVICRQGEMGDSFYIIDSGKVNVEIDSIVRATLEAGDYFGEIGLIMDCPRVATVIAREPTVLLQLKSNDFQELLQRSSSLKEGIERTSSRRVLLNQRWSKL
jgi:CRP-like cAMP-binding protein